MASNAQPTAKASDAPDRSDAAAVPNSGGVPTSGEPPRETRAILAHSDPIVSKQLAAAPHLELVKLLAKPEPDGAAYTSRSLASVERDCSERTGGGPALLVPVNAFLKFKSKGVYNVKPVLPVICYTPDCTRLMLCVRSIAAEKKGEPFVIDLDAQGKNVAASIVAGLWVHNAQHATNLHPHVCPLVRAVQGLFPDAALECALPGAICEIRTLKVSVLAVPLAEKDRASYGVLSTLKKGHTDVRDASKLATANMYRAQWLKDTEGDELHDTLRAVESMAKKQDAFMQQKMGDVLHKATLGVAQPPPLPPPRTAEEEAADAERAAQELLTAAPKAKAKKKDRKKGVSALIADGADESGDGSDDDSEADALDEAEAKEDAAWINDAVNPETGEPIESGNEDGDSDSDAGSGSDDAEDQPARGKKRADSVSSHELPDEDEGEGDDEDDDEGEEDEEDEQDEAEDDASDVGGGDDAGEGMGSDDEGRKRKKPKKVSQKKKAPPTAALPEKPLKRLKKYADVAEAKQKGKRAASAPAPAPAAEAAAKQTKLSKAAAQTAPLAPVNAPAAQREGTPSIAHFLQSAAPPAAPPAAAPTAPTALVCVDAPAPAAAAPPEPASVCARRSAASGIAAERRSELLKVYEATYEDIKSMATVDRARDAAADHYKAALEELKGNNTVRNYNSALQRANDLVDRLVRGTNSAAVPSLVPSHEAGLSNIAIGRAGVDVLMKVIPQLREMQAEATKLAQMGTSIMSLTSEAVVALSQAVSDASAAETEAVVQNAI